MVIQTKSQNNKFTRFLYRHRIGFGMILIALVTIISFYGTGWFGWLYAEGSGNGILLYDSGLYIYTMTFSITTIVSYRYFSYCKISVKVLRPLYAVAILLFGSYFLFQLTDTRNTQRLVLNSYQEFQQAIEIGDFGEAYNRMSPTYRQDHTIDDLKEDYSAYWSNLETVNTIYSVNIRLGNSRPFIIPSSKTTHWYRDFTGVPLVFENIDGQWFFTGVYYLHNVDP